MIAGTVEADFNLAAVKGERHFQHPAGTKGKHWADDAEQHDERGG